MTRVNIERILCPIDFSEFSRDALDHAVALATWYRATLTVMHVIEIPPVPIDGPPVHTAAFAPAVDRDTAANEVTNFARRALGDADVRTEVVVAFGAPAGSIRLLAERIRADLVIVGT